MLESPSEIKHNIRRFSFTGIQARTQDENAKLAKKQEDST